MFFFHQQNFEPQILHNQKVFYEPHLHDDVEIIIVYQGNFQLLVDQTRYAICSGDAIIIFPNTIHGYSSGENIDVGKFIFDTENIQDLNSIFHSMQPKTPVIDHSLVLQANLLNLSTEILHCYHSSSPVVRRAYLLLLAGKILELFKLEERPQTDDHDLLVNLFRFCKQHYRTDIHLKDVADALYISPSYLSHIFCEKLKINFCQYINTLRIHEACRLLRQTELKISEIAEQSGFSSLRSFDRAFFKQFGLTPKNYRNISCTSPERP